MDLDLDRPIEEKPLRNMLYLGVGTFSTFASFAVPYNPDQVIDNLVGGALLFGGLTLALASQYNFLSSKEYKKRSTEGFYKRSVLLGEAIKSEDNVNYYEIRDMKVPPKKLESRLE